MSINKPPIGDTVLFHIEMESLANLWSVKLLQAQCASCAKIWLSTAKAFLITLSDYAVELASPSSMIGNMETSYMTVQ